MRRTTLALAVILVLLFPSMAYAQITGSYSNGADVNFAAFDFTLYSPNGQTVYADTMLLEFNINWTACVYFPFPGVAPPLIGDYSYSIDDGPRVTIESNQSASDRVIVDSRGNFTINPSFSYSVNVSSLANGYHEIVIIVGLYRPHKTGYYYINQSTIPTQLQVQNSSTPPIPEFPSWTILPLFLIATFSVIVARKKLLKTS